MKFIDQQLESYCIEHSSPEPSLCKEIASFTRAHVHGSQMLIGPMEGAVLGMFIKLIQAKKILEFGTYTGYSALTMAEHMDSDGEVTTVDVNAETTKIAQDFWKQSPKGSRIKSILKSGLEFIQEDHSIYDLIFIDADKNNYSNYLNWALKHVRPGGVIITDNTLWSGQVLEQNPDKQTQSIINHNKLAYESQGFFPVLLPIRDGMMVLMNLSNNN